jgi:lysophospholipase L1-like esterase
MKRRIVFAGDSIIHGGPWQFWLPDHYVTNFAFPGHTTSDLAALVDDIVESQPELLIVMIGTNDFGKYRLPIEDVIENILANANDLRKLLPDVPIIWNSLTPRTGEFSQSVIEVNAEIKPELEALGIIFFDSHGLLKDETQDILKIKYCSDPETFGLHLNNAGYEEWFRALAPVISNNLVV